MELIDKIRLENLQSKTVKIQVRIPQSHFDLFEDLCKKDSTLDISKVARYFMMKGILIEGAFYDDQ